jgi:hypothetical protein
MAIDVWPTYTGLRLLKHLVTTHSSFQEECVGCVTYARHCFTDLKLIPKMFSCVGYM